MPGDSGLQTGRRPASGISLVLILAVAVALAALRLVHLDADTPRSQWDGSVAIFVDEGYKTLSPRNLVLFGDTHWNAADDYPGWMAGSPLTQWAYFLAFRALGVEMASARIVTVAAYLLLLAGFVLLLRRRYSTSVLLTGVVLLGVLETLFFFSRLALFEIPVATLLYLSLFLLARRRQLRPSLALAVVLAGAVVATLGVKPTGLLYFAPALAGVVLGLKLRAPAPTRVRAIEAVSAGLLIALVLLEWDAWAHRFDLSPTVPRSFLLNPITISTGLLIAAALLSLSHGLLVEGRRYLADPYRAALVCVATLCPLLLALFPRNPLRYYVPLLPAYVLLIVEWLQIRPWRRPIPETLSAARAMASFLLLVWAVFCFGQVLDQRLLARLLPAEGIQWLRGSGAGLWNSPRFFAAAALGLLLGLLVWRWRRRVLVGWPVAAGIVALVALESAQGLVAEGRFLARPGYESQAIASRLQERLPRGASIAGDWAPWFATETTLKALYMTTDFNHPRRILDTRPDYFLFCADPSGDGREVRSLLERADGVDLGAPVMEATYVGFEIIAYPISYAVASPAAAGPAAPVE